MQITFFTDRGSNPVCPTGSPALYCVDIKDDLYRNAVRVCYIPIPDDIYENLLCNKASVISSIVRVCFKTFSAKKNLNTCTDKLFDTNAKLIGSRNLYWFSNFRNKRRFG